MPKKKSTDKLIPGNARVSLHLYRAEGRTYTPVPGMSMAGIAVCSKKELERLFKALDDVVLGAQWRDMNQTV